MFYTCFFSVFFFFFLKLNIFDKKIKKIIHLLCIIKHEENS